MAVDGPLNVIALVSGGKDSFFSILHCLANDHRVVALANLHPPDHPNASAIAPLPSHPGATEQRPISDAPAPLASSTDAGHGSSKHDSECADGETDLNSFMYQTVGHQVVPLYATATGLPLFRRAITGTTVDHGISYQDPVLSSTAPPFKADGPQQEGPTSDPGAVVVDDKRDLGEEDETESLIPLLQSVMAAHPEANAVCTGAILSTYQRTRVESIALRLGLIPLGYLWQYPVLPPPLAAAEESPRSQPDDAQLLREMESVGLEARIVKVASAGLDEDFLWENVASEKSIQRVKRVLRKFGGGGRGSELGEGGEFETLVVDGPPALFKGRIVVHDADTKIVREGGGSLWLSIRKASVEMKPQGQSSNEQIAGKPIVRTPALLDARFEPILEALHTDVQIGDEFQEVPLAPLPQTSGVVASNLPEQWCLLGSSQETSTESQTSRLVDTVRQRLRAQSLSSLAITNTIIVLRHMSDFPAINKLYGALFQEPNPPARVTIACGDCLPQGSEIAIYLTVQPCLGQNNRQGLHVQSRSYWAPANIGPYSQAIAFPSGPSNADHSAMKITTIAGQIPLIPASMVLPASDDSSGGDTTDLQITLALQHLWRIGTEMQVQWWTSAVAYFPRTPLAVDIRRKTTLAAHAWDAAHLWGLDTEASEEDDDETGPDLWDRKFNPQYMSLTGGGDDEAAPPSLPDWDVLASAYLTDTGKNGEENPVQTRRRYIPYMFAAEVDELPRAAGIEWQAHLGLAKVGSGSVRTFATTVPTRLDGRHLELYHVVVRPAAGGDIYVHTTAAFSLDKEHEDNVSPSSPVTFCGDIDTISIEVGAAPEDIDRLTKRGFVPSWTRIGNVRSPSLPDVHRYLPCVIIFLEYGRCQLRVQRFSSYTML
ncbi:meiotically up-regulated 71 protein [Apiospora arundinis]